MPASNGSCKECTMDDGFPKMELEVRTQVRSGRTGKPTNVAGYRERRLSSCRRLKKERGMSSRCSTASSEAATVVQDGSRSVPPSSHRSNQSTVRTGGTFLTEASPRDDTSLGRDSIAMKDRRASLGRTARTSSLTSRFRSRCNRIKLRSVVHCIGAETDHSSRSPDPENQEEEVEKTDAVTCFKSTRGEQKKKSKGSFCAQTESNVSSPIKALFTETPFKPYCKVTSPVSTAFTRIFKVRLLKQKSAPALMSDKRCPAGPIPQPPSPTPVRRFRRQETLVRMMEKELAQPSEYTTQARLGQTRRAVTDIEKHRTTPEKSSSKTPKKKSRKAKSRSSSKQVVHKRCATC